MTPVSLGLDSLLALLLIAALSVGVRLNAKLKLLRESHAGFAKAVADLDLAAGRAEAGLSALRSATQEAHDTLLSRIETARSLASRLEQACADAGAHAERLDAAAVRAQSAAARAERAPPPAAEPARREGSETAAVLRLIETARVQAGDAAAAFGALRAAPPLTLAAAAPPAPLAQVPPVSPLPVSPLPAEADRQPSADAAGDRLARFVARRREARAG